MNNSIKDCHPRPSNQLFYKILDYERELKRFRLRHGETAETTKLIESCHTIIKQVCRRVCCER